MDLDCLSQNVSILRLYDYQKWVNICVFCEYYYFSLLKREIYTFSAKQLKSITNSENLRTKSSFENIFIYLFITIRLQIKIQNISPMASGILSFKTSIVSGLSA